MKRPTPASDRARQMGLDSRRPEERLPENGHLAQADFSIALLCALQQVGDGSFVQPVKQLLRNGWINKRVKAAAAESLPYLQAIAEQEQNRDRLVRAALAPKGSDQSARLVRPVGTGTDTRRELLLRPLDEEAV